MKNNIKNLVNVNYNNYIHSNQTIKIKTKDMWSKIKFSEIKNISNIQSDVLVLLPCLYGYMDYEGVFVWRR